MNVSGAGSGPPVPVPDAIRILANAVAPLPSSFLPTLPDDSVSASLTALSAEPIQRLLQVVDELLLRTAPNNAAAVDTPTPHAAEGAYLSPAQALAQNADRTVLEIKHLAEKSVASAAHLIETGGNQGHRVPGDLDPRTVLALASRFIETAQVPNYQRAAELGNIVASWYPAPATTGPPKVPARPAAKPARGEPDRPLRFRLRIAVKNLWRRAPLLLLLTGWLLSGAIPGLFLRILKIPAGQLAWEIWAAGFLALVVFQFVVTIRRKPTQPARRYPGR